MCFEAERWLFSERYYWASHQILLLRTNSDSETQNLNNSLNASETTPKLLSVIG